MLFELATMVVKDILLELLKVEEGGGIYTPAGNLAVGETGGPDIPGQVMTGYSTTSGNLRWQISDDHPRVATTARSGP